MNSCPYSRRLSRISVGCVLAIILLLPGPRAFAFRFVTTSDSHVSAEKDPNAVFGYVVSRIDGLSPRPDLWIFGGDAYDDASDSADAMAQWQAWKYIIDPISDIPVYPAIGNHDANIYYHDWDGAGPFRASWPDLPQNGPAGYKGTVYALRHQNAIFCVVNTNLYYPSTYSARFKVDQAQRDWLAAVLDTTTAIHRFVIGHVEAWPPSDGGGNSSLQWNPADRDAFWQVMADGGVQAYVCGHIHLWNRDYFAASGYGNPPADTSVRQVICGGAGGGLVPGYGGNFYHFVVWDVEGAQVTARVVDSYGNLRDSLKYTVTTGVAGGSNEPAPPRVGIKNIRWASGTLLWDGFVGVCDVDVYNIAGQALWRGTGSGGRVKWSLGEKGRAKAGSGIYLIRIRSVGDSSLFGLGRVVIVR
jgi:3',5'-cyclic AMP phosphodiesterase CpdA